MCPAGRAPKNSTAFVLRLLANRAFGEERMVDAPYGRVDFYMGSQAPVQLLPMNELKLTTAKTMAVVNFNVPGRS